MNMSLPAPPNSGNIIRASSNMDIGGLTFVGPSRVIETVDKTNERIRNVRDLQTSPSSAGVQRKPPKPVDEMYPTDKNVGLLDA